MARETTTALSNHHGASVLADGSSMNCSDSGTNGWPRDSARVVGLDHGWLGVYLACYSRVAMLKSKVIDCSRQ